MQKTEGVRFITQLFLFRCFRDGEEEQSSFGHLIVSRGVGGDLRRWTLGAFARRIVFQRIEKITAFIQILRLSFKIRLKVQGDRPVADRRAVQSIRRAQQPILPCVHSVGAEISIE